MKYVKLNRLYLLKNRKKERKKKSRSFENSAYIHLLGKPAASASAKKRSC